MKSKVMKKVIAMMITVLMVFSMTACGSSSSKTTETETTGTESTTESTDTDTTETADTDSTEETKELSGTISLAGSTSMEKVCEALMEGFMEAYPDVTVTTEYTGSSAGLESLNAGSVDIGNASRHVKDEEKGNGAVENVIALDGIAVIVDKTNTVEDLTSEQLKSIYKGEITNWSEIGGQDSPITVIGRESGSGTRDAFEEILEIKDSCNYAQELDSTGAVLAKTASIPGAIGYVSLDVVDDTVKAVMIDSVDANEENIIAGTYLLHRPFVMATIGEISEQSDLVKEWFAYMQSDEGKEIIRGAGLILPE